jgi:hypothetical protein
MMTILQNKGKRKNELVMRTSLQNKRVKGKEAGEGA